MANMLRKYSENRLKHLHFQGTKGEKSETIYFIAALPAVNKKDLTQIRIRTNAISFKVHNQIQQWFGNKLKPEQWGWVGQDADLHPVRITVPSAPYEIIKLIPYSAVAFVRPSGVVSRKAKMPLFTLNILCGNGLLLQAD